MIKTTYRYLFLEIFHVFLVGLMIFMIFLLMDKIFKLIELIVSRGAAISQILMLLLFISPSFLVLTIPMAILLGTLLTFGRMSGDNEITAFKASGVSLYQLSVPVILLSLGAFLLTAFLVFYGLPWGNRGFKAMLFLMAQSQGQIEIKERVFNDEFEGLVVYVDKVPIDGERMEGILIYDEREEGKTNTIFAKQGFLIPNPKSQDVTLRLVQGDIHRFESKTNVFHKIQFETYDLKLELAKTFASIRKKLQEHEMSIDEIRQRILTLQKEGKPTTAQEVELHKRYAIPFTCIVFALIAIPLGIQPRRSGRSHGFVLGILLLLAYYIALSGSEILAVQQQIPAYLAGWAPNLLFGGLGMYLLVKAANESPFKPLVRLDETIDALQRKWKWFLGENADV